MIRWVQRLWGGRPEPPHSSTGNGEAAARARRLAEAKLRATAAQERQVEDRLRDLDRLAADIDRAMRLRGAG